MEITKSEKLILLMLSEIYEKLEIKSIDTKFLTSAISSGNTWAIEWEIPELRESDQDMPPREVIDVVDYLDMWMFIEDASKSLSQEDREKIESLNLPFGTHLLFPGFDGNNEDRQLTIAKLLIEDMGRFTKFQGRNLNSHAPMLKIYAGMYNTFIPMRDSLAGIRNLTSDQIIEILKAAETSLTN
ncbi:YfbU family protein [Pseudomonas sp. TH15]|uniref:YfbU family protein n=1 Tax=Pseudomonas sp. TH15 TaxID=2796381 RepID=UPI0019124334|nr:YfbU family protein [Pseudomonas sp. TH15]MBK5511704.1 YfbU family protein [Pseudomonas sp. TH15]